MSDGLGSPGGTANPARLLTTLQRLLGVDTTDPRTALAETAGLVADALRADKTDIMFYEAARHSLVAVGTSDTPMGRRQKALGLDWMPIANGGRAVQVFQDGQPHLNGRVHEDPRELPGLVDGLGICSEIIVPLDVAGELRGVLLASSVQVDYFSADDLSFLASVARWVGVVLHRAELAERQRDLDAERRARTTVEAERARLNAILDQMPAGVALAEIPSGRLVYHNATAIALIGHPMLESADVTGYAQYGALHPDGSPYTPEEYPIARAVRGEVVGFEEMRYRRGDGTETYFLVNATPLRDTTGGNVLAVSTFIDIAERRRAVEAEAAARAEAEAAVRVRDELLATVSHDLKNPLTSLKGRVQLLCRRLAAEPDRADVLGMLAAIEIQADAMRRMIDQLLDVTRMQIGQPLPLQRQRVDLAVLADRLVGQYAATTSQHQLTLHGAGPGQLIGRWDADRLEQVIGNLLANAIKYSPDGGQIDVTLGADDAAGAGWATLAVRDRGLGIPPADLPRLFERFYRGQNVSGRIPGVGIGLAGAQQIVRQHGGTISVESVEGQGSTFTVRLPIAPPTPATGSDTTIDEKDRSP